MATKLENLDIEIAHFNAFKEYLPKFDALDQYTVELMLEMGIVEVSSAFEQAIAEYSGTEVISKDNADLSCGSDAKLSTVRTSGYGKTYSAPVSGIHNKDGDLLIQIYERKKNMFYWLRMPYESYMHIPKTSNIEIPFEMDGTPRRRNNCRINPWKYECKSFEDMCLNDAVMAQNIEIFNNLFEERANG